MTQRAKLSDTADLAVAQAFAREVFAALRDREFARAGRWSTWEGGALMLEITALPDGRQVAPVTIVAADGAIAFAARDWEVHLPREGHTLAQAIDDLDDLARRWFGGAMALAAFYLGDVWKGVVAIDPALLEDELARGLRWIGGKTAVDRVEIQYFDPAADERFGLAVNGKPLTPPN